MENMLLSIIIPIYNAENFINKILDSILIRNFKDYEIILINDGSNDKSKDICNEYSKKYGHINCYHIENRGSFQARVYGIKKSKGKYIVFMDVDDFIDEDYFENIDSEFKAYILGFIFADGFVGEHNDFCISLSDKVNDNLRILKMFQNELKIDDLIYHSIDKDGNGKYTFKFSNEKIVRDLNKNGVYTCKSLTLEYVPNIRKNLMNHFIRGYFDGDGSICSWYDKYDNRQRYCMEILGTKKFLLQIQEILCSECHIKETKLHDVNHTQGLTRISHRGIKNLIKIREYLYKNSTVFLTYKHNRFYNIQPL